LVFTVTATVTLPEAPPAKVPSVQVNVPEELLQLLEQLTKLTPAGKESLMEAPVTLTAESFE